MNEKDDRLLSALIDGESDEGELRGLFGPVDAEARYVSGSLLRRHATLRALSDAMRNQGKRYNAPLRLKMLPEKVGAGKPSKSAGWFTAFLKPQMAGAVLCTALVSVTATSLVLHNNGDEALESDLVSMHLRSLMTPNPVDVVSSDSHTVKPWFNGRIKYSPPVEDFAAQGFPLIGGRLEVFSSEPVSSLVYRHKQHLINLYVLPARLGKRYAALKNTERDGFNIMARQSGEFIYVAVSDLNGGELGELMQLATNAPK